MLYRLKMKPLAVLMSLLMCCGILLTLVRRFNIPS
jgi:hypothetical protein